MVETRKMNFKERDKSFIKDINSNIIRVGQVEDSTSKIYFLAKVVNDGMVFSIVLKNRCDYKHSLQYIETSINANKEIKTILEGIFDNIKECKKEDKK